MAKLCIYLPPFASDYTGVCSSLFDLECLIAINDASCCTAHYVYGDEPRWEEKVRPVFSTQLRTIDAVLGNEQKVIDSVSRAAEGMDISMIALVGTPVPAITGMDMEGMACEIEDRTGICSLGFSTTGFNYYDRGIAAAGKALIQRFTRKTGETEYIPRSVNILGMTPLDYGNVGTDHVLRNELETAGWKVNGCLFMGTTKEQVENLARAQVNLAVSASGLEIAGYLKMKFGTPYVAAAPVGRTAFQNLLKDLEKSCIHEDCSEFNLHQPDYICQSDHEKPVISDTENAGTWNPTDQQKNRILIVMDQIIGISLRRVLEQGTFYTQEKTQKLNNTRIQADIASFFGLNPALARKGDVYLKSEKDLLNLLRSGRYQTIIGDPLLADIPDIGNLHHIKLVHPAVSGNLHWNDVPEYLSDEFDRLIQQAIFNGKN